jgi:acyl carrier protein
MIKDVIIHDLCQQGPRITSTPHFTDDLGADWLGRLELMTVVEDHFAGVEISDADVDRIEVVGDLIRHIETVDNERRRRGAAPVIRNLFGPRLARAMKPTKQQGWELVALFFLRLAGDPVRNLMGWCPETRQPIDLQIYVDDATLARIWSNLVRFQCPHCGTKHETRSSGLPRGHSRSNPLKRNARGISTPRNGKVGEQRVGAGVARPQNRKLLGTTSRSWRQRGWQLGIQVPFTP